MPDESARGFERNLPLGPGGEFDLVRTMLDCWGDLAHGVGDDAAVLDVPPGERLVVSTDSSVEDVHFRRAWLSPSDIAYRATVSALSDLAAMAARPLGMVVALTLPTGWVDDLAALADGIGEAAASHGAPIVGGDITRGAQLSLAITVLGTAPAPVRRSGVRPGDVLYVTGLLGGPGAALRALLAGETAAAAHFARFARPHARVREALWLARQGASAMIDISDGLSAELRHLAEASGCELRIDLARVPVLRGCTVEEATRSGEEYELVVACPHELDADTFARTFAIPLSEIGHARVAERPGVAAFRDGVRVDLGMGHDHFTP